MQNRLREIRTFDLNFRAYESSESWAAISIAREIEQQYVFPEIELNPGDVIVDIGAHIGIFSIYYALKYPNVHIYSYEPTRRNYNNFVKSLEYNKVYNVNPHNLAVTGDGRRVEMYQPADNTGASSVFYDKTKPFQEKSEAYSVTLKDLFKEVQFQSKKIKILKIDCEGAEYEIFEDSLNLLKDVEYIMGELHHVPDSKFNAHLLNEKITSIVGKEKNKLTIIQTNTII